MSPRLRGLEIIKEYSSPDSQDVASYVVSLHKFMVLITVHAILIFFNLFQ